MNKVKLGNNEIENYRKSRISKLKVSETIYVMHVKVHIFPYVRWTLLWINVAEKWNCLRTFSGCVPHRTTDKSAEQLSSGNRSEIND
jgi:hypothetical protein